MAADLAKTNQAEGRAYIITGPTSGFGRATALEVSKYGTVILLGRDRAKLDAVQKTIKQKGGHAVSVVCDISDIAGVRRAAAAIVNLNLPLAGLINSAGVLQMRPTKSAQGWEMSYATNYLGPFVLTEALTPELPDGANVVFIVSGVEDPARLLRVEFPQVPQALAVLTNLTVTWMHNGNFASGAFQAALRTRSIWTSMQGPHPLNPG